MSFHYAILARESPKPWDREDRSTVLFEFLPEHGLFSSYSEQAYALLETLNADVDKKYQEHRDEVWRTNDHGCCPSHGDQDGDVYDGIYGDCSCDSTYDQDYWANRNGLVYHKLYVLSDEEALYWMETGVKVVDE